MSHQRLTEHTPIMIIIMIIVQVHMTNNDRCGIFDNTDVDLVARLLENIKGRRPDVDDERFQLRGAEHFQSLQVG